MSDLIKHSEIELKLAGLFDKDSDYNGMLGDAVMELVRVFSNQGHSGFSAKSTIQLFSKVADYGILEPLQGSKSEWQKQGNSYQNIRKYNVFYKNNISEAYYSNAVVWHDVNNDHAFIGEVEGISSVFYIKSFPFFPKTFYVDVKENEHGDYQIVGDKCDQMKPVYDFYSRTKKRV